MNFKLKKEDFDSVIKEISDSMLERFEGNLSDKMIEWRSEDSKPAISNELPPNDMMPSIVDPKAKNQPSELSLPIQDPDWKPHNITELGNAMKQLAQMIPEEEIDWFYSKIRTMIDTALDRVDGAKMHARLGKDQ